MEKLNVFVSSTCYDLSQIRSDLHDYIDSNGHNPILSESKNFPVNPAKKTIDNCISAVNNYADIFILIVGSRYGNEVDSGQSITNKEFLAAQSKKIPIYIFIEKRVLNYHTVWQNNKSGDFSKVVDSTKIFEFISELRDGEKFWTFEFEKAQDIVSIMKTQMSYLFKESLEIRAKFNAGIDDLFKLSLSNEALDIVLTKGPLFEANFFAQTLIDELKKKEMLKNDYEYNIILESRHAIYENESLIPWFRQRIDTILNLVTSLNSLYKDVFPFYFGEPGVPSDLKGLYYTSQTYARIFESILLWTIETSSTSVSDDSIDVRNKLAKLSSKIIDQIWEFPFDKKTQIDNAIKLVGTDKALKELKMMLTISIDENHLEDYKTAFAKFSKLVLAEAKEKY